MMDEDVRAILSRLVAEDTRWHDPDLVPRLYYQERAAIRAAIVLLAEVERLRAQNAAKLAEVLAEWAADGYEDTGGDDSPDAGIIICTVCCGESKGRFMDFAPSDHADNCLLARTEALLANEEK